MCRSVSLTRAPFFLPVTPLSGAAGSFHWLLHHHRQALKNTLLLCYPLLFLNSTPVAHFLPYKGKDWTSTLWSWTSCCLWCWFVTHTKKVVRGHIIIKVDIQIVMMAPTVPLCFEKVICAYLVACVSVIASCKWVFFFRLDCSGCYYFFFGRFIVNDPTTWKPIE